MSKSQNKNVFQENSEEILREFINYYYTCLNQKNFAEIFKFFKDFTKIKFDSVEYKGFKSLQDLYNNLNLYNFIYTVNSYDYLMSGNHRMDILVTGKIQINEDVKYFTEYIHFGTCKNNENGYLIYSSVFKSF